MNYLPDDRAAEMRQLFFDSAQELLEALNEDALRLERDSSNLEAVRNIRRIVHTLKGDSGVCGFKELQDLAHEVEDALQPEIASKHSLAVSQLVMLVADVFTALIKAYRDGEQIPSTAELRQRVHDILSQSQSAPSPAPAQQNSTAKFAWTEYERLAITRMRAGGQQIFNIALQFDTQCAMPAAALQLVYNVLQHYGEIVAVRPEHPEDVKPSTIVELAFATTRPADWVATRCRIPAVVAQATVAPCPVVDVATSTIAGPVETISSTNSVSPGNAGVAVERSRPASDGPGATPASAPSPGSLLRVDSQRIDDVLNLVGELIIGKSMLQQTAVEIGSRLGKDPLRNRLLDVMAFQSRVLNDLQRSVMKIRMVPVEQLFRRFPRMVRDVAQHRKKQVALVANGLDTELDKSILDNMAEPLTHLLRNAVDHGIETAEERVKAGKPAEGTIRLNAYHQGNQIVLEVSDDGRGIDTAKVLSRAIERGLIEPEEAQRLKEPDIHQFLFHPGFSTADQVTEISGRGVGLDVVQSVMNRLKGTVTVESRPGQGTTFLLRVPLTLAIIKALMFQVENHLYAVPLGVVVEIARMSEADVHRVDQSEVVQLRDSVLTLLRLGFRPIDPAMPRKLFVIVINVAGQKFGLAVDQLAGEEELVIKALDDRMVSTELVSGASILGDGTVVLILNLPAVVERLLRLPAAGIARNPFLQMLRTSGGTGRGVHA